MLMNRVTAGDFTIQGYEVQEFIGWGITSRVFRATERRTGRPAALKVFEERFLEDRYLTRRYRKEVEALNLLKRTRHPNVLRIYDYGLHFGRLWIATEWAPGGNLDRLLSDRPWGAGLVVRYLSMLAAGLACGHALDVVHRDLKPSNVLVGADGRLIIGDWGLSLLGGQSQLTPQAPLGTPGYWSPEVLRHGGHVATWSSDMYAVGVIAYKALTGRMPSHCLPGWKSRAEQDLPRPFVDIGPLENLGLHGRLYRVLAHLLAEDPDRRPSAVKLQEILARL